MPDKLALDLQHEVTEVPRLPGVGKAFAAQGAIVPTPMSRADIAAFIRQDVAISEPVGLGDRRLQLGRSGPILASPHFLNTGVLSHSYGYGPANPAKTVLAGAKFRFDAPSPTSCWRKPITELGITAD